MITTNTTIPRKPQNENVYNQNQSTSQSSDIIEVNDSYETNFDFFFNDEDNETNLLY